LLQQKGVLAIPRSSKEANVQANADVFDIVLSEEEMQAIHGLGSPAGRLVSPSMAPDWD
jgi:2,5-diketo-D-gluconate reductase B